MIGGKPYLTMDTNLDPDNNYYNDIIHHIDNCDYYDEDKFKKLLRTTNETNFSILHCNIRRIFLRERDNNKLYLHDYNKYSIAKAIHS